MTVETYREGYRDGVREILERLDKYAEDCRYENERRGKLEKDEIIISALAGAALAFDGMRNKIKEIG